jgi:hypothetical protein
MVNGIHALFYAQDADKVRGFFKDVLKLGSVDAGEGWLIFALPPAELGIHPTEDKPHHELYLMCDDIQATMKDLKARGRVRASRQGPRVGSGHGNQGSRRRRNGPVRTTPSDRAEAEALKYVAAIDNPASIASPLRFARNRASGYNSK